MNIDVFLRSRDGDWAELANLMTSCKGKLSRLDGNSIVRFSVLYRAACADLAFARREYAGDAVQYNLESMVSKCSSMMYEHRSVDKKKLFYFLTVGAFASIAHRPKLLLVSFLLMMGPWIIAGVYANVNPENTKGLAAGVENVVNRPSADFQLTPSQRAQVSSQIYTNNIKITLLAFVGGIAVGIGSILALIYNGIALGTTTGLTIEAGNSSTLWQFIAPHGFLEISCIIVAGAAGLRVGWAILNPGFRTRSLALREEGKEALASALVVALSLFFCGIIEGMVSTTGVPTPVGMVIGIGVASIFWGIIIAAGIYDAGRRNAVIKQEEFALAA